MKLIVDSGSTKAEFRLIGEDVEKMMVLPGINPYYQTEEDIATIIKEVTIELGKYSPAEIYFYGAGCAFPEKKEKLRRVFRQFFSTDTIFVENDLLAASRALFGKRRGVACILGTGSNSCLYDGKSIVKNIPPLGFILGDEGSGAVLGKKLVGDCLKNQLSLHLQEKFFLKYHINPEEIMENVYRKPFPNRYLASFTPFLLENINEMEIYKLVKKSFLEFFERNLEQYPIRDEKLGFIGSIAYYFQDLIKEIIQEKGYELYKIMKNPMPGLIEYHRNKK
jgi:N-acetylglucosamine kinase-like BadF-type ATPase